MRRDPRRFILVGWCLLDAPAQCPVNLNIEWRRRFGHLPPERPDSVRGFHFQTARGRAVHIPETGSRPDVSLVARACALVSGKYGLETRTALASELPSVPPVTTPTRAAAEAVELWPPPDLVSRDAVVLEHASGSLYVSRWRLESEWAPATPDPSEALTFADADEAASWQALCAPTEHLVLRYRAAALAEFDLRETHAAGFW